MWSDANFISFKSSNQDFTFAELTDSANAAWLVAFYNDCDAGYICYEGSTVANPVLPMGEACPEGHFCVAGALVARPCPPGYIQASTLAATCDPCPAGYYCPEFGMLVGYACEKGYYCEGT